MGGRPSKGTPADRRLKANRGTTPRRGATSSGSGMAAQKIVMPPVKGHMPMQGKQGRKH